MFDVVLRDEVEGYLVRLAEVDERITAAAVVASRAHTEGDRWSDIDLTFAVADATAPVAVLDEWAANCEHSSTAQRCSTSLQVPSPTACSYCPVPCKSISR